MRMTIRQVLMVWMAGTVCLALILMIRIHAGDGGHKQQQQQHPPSKQQQKQQQRWQDGTIPADGPNGKFHSKDQPAGDWRSFGTFLTKTFAANATVLLAMVDTSYVDMALNFYVTSLRKFSIREFVFVGITRRACQELRASAMLRAGDHMPCFTLTTSLEIPDTGAQASVYRSDIFNRKMNVRTDMILHALLLGFTVVHADLDVVFLRNPFTDLRQILEKSPAPDVIPMWDHVVYNAGFIVVRPTEPAVWIYKRMRQLTERSPHTDDQQALNRAITDCRNRHHGTCLVTSLPRDIFQCGYYYFEDSRRYFGESVPTHKCAKCAVVHNNWIVSKEAKVYRFKENLLWFVDKEAYYSSGSQNYMTYTNPDLYHSKNLSMVQDREIQVLMTALCLSALLQRVLILPHFHCADETNGSRVYECPLNSLLALDAFDAQFSSDYRESSFLRHPLIPKTITSSFSHIHLIQNSTNQSDAENVAHRRPMSSKDASKRGGASLTEVFRRLVVVRSHVLVIHDLHDITDCENVVGAVDVKFREKLRLGIKRSTYRQYEGGR